MKVLKFSSVKCPPCKTLSDYLESHPPEGIEIISISGLENNKDIFGKYGVRAVPIVIEIGEDDEPLRKWTGTSFINFLEKRSVLKQESSIKDIIVNSVEEVINK